MWRRLYDKIKCKERQTTAGKTEHLLIYFQVGLLDRTLRSTILVSPEKLSTPSVLGRRAFPAAPNRADNKDNLFGFPGDLRVEDSANTLLGPVLIDAFGSCDIWGIRLDLRRTLSFLIGPMFDLRLPDLVPNDLGVGGTRLLGLSERASRTLGT